MVINSLKHTVVFYVLTSAIINLQKRTGGPVHHISNIQMSLFLEYQLLLDSPPKWATLAQNEGIAQ